MIITIQLHSHDDPEFAKVVAEELRSRISAITAPVIDVRYPSGRTIMF